MKKSFKLLAAALMAFAMSVPAQALELTIYDGNDVSECVPIRPTYYDYWDQYKVQFIYPEAELSAMVGEEIHSMKFYFADAQGNPGTNVMNGGKMSILIGTTDETSFGGWSPSFISEDGLTTVAEISMTHGDAELLIEFDNAWTYNGGNIIIETRLEAEGTYSNYGYFLGKTTNVANAAYGLYSVATEGFYPKATFTYGGEEPQTNVATTLAQANAMEDNAEFTFNGDAVVTICWNGSVYLRDESGYGQIVDGATFENGQVLSQGWNATKTSVNGWVKYTDATGLSASGETNAELAAAQVLTAFPDESMLNAYVVIENVTKSFLPIRSITLPDGSTISLTGNGNQPATGSFNVYGLIWKSGETLVLEPVAWEKYVAPEWQLGDVNHDTKINVADVTALIQYVLGVDVDPFFPEQANVDGDAEGKYNVADVTALIQLVLQN